MRIQEVREDLVTEGNSKLQIAIFVLMFVIAALILLAVVGNVFESNKTMISPVPAVAPTPTVAAEDVFKAEYMGGCLTEGATNYSYCSFTYDRLLAKFGKAGIANEGLEYLETKKVSDNMLEAAEACMYLSK